jgi:hypothetical protein
MRIVPLTAVALTAALGFAGGEASASRLEVDNVDAWYQHARSVIGPIASTEDLINQREVIAPPASIDPGINMTPLDDHSRLRIITPPGTRDDGIQPK